LVQRAFYASLGRKVVTDSAAVIPRSLSARAHLLEQGVPERKLSDVVHSGVDTSTFSPMDQDACRAHFLLEGKGPVLINVSRLHPNKGLDRLILAMKELRKEHPRAMLVIKGKGPWRAYLEGLIRSEGLTDHVRIIAKDLPREEMPMLYCTADLAVVSSVIDLFPFSAIEAIACGVPLASAFGRGLRTDIIDQGAGLPISQAPEMMGKELALILSDSAKLRSMGSVGRRLALDSFDFGVCAERLLTIYGGGGNAL